MSLESAKDAALNYLFESYLQSPSGLTDLSRVIKDNGFEDPNEIGKYLVENGWISGYQYRTGAFVATISQAGIDEIAPEYFEENLSNIISTIGVLGGGRQSIMEILEWEPKDFMRARDIAKYLEGTRYFKKSQYLGNDVIIELSLEGMDYFNENRAKFTD